MWRKDNIYSRHGEKTIYTLILQQDTRLLYGYVPKIHVLHAWRKNNIYTNFSQPLLQLAMKDVSYLCYVDCCGNKCISLQWE